MSGILAFLASPVLDRFLKFIPNPAEREKARQELQTELLRMASEERMAQVELNKTEAKHASIFVAGWRPFIGWVGGVSLGYTFVLHPVIAAIATYSGYEGAIPNLETEELMTLVGAMLGVGAMRSFDKTKGVDTKSIGSTKPTYNE